ncbi:MAG: carbamoyl-phosphate synthase large subunit [Oenococcus sp.]|uniref:carbamoyl-phosphate synthase large subunit n=1 Tax=Oenococcus sp. TaxID=1979414 RepID=UPI0039EA2065
MSQIQTFKKILVIGSGPIIIGQAAEFDYSGTQASLALKESGYEVVLINSNPATIMTDPKTADHVYIEPLTLPAVKAVIHKEMPQAILATLGGQTALNLAKELAEDGILNELGIELLGTKLDAIEQAEDREKFKNLMAQLGEPTPPSQIARNLSQALAFADKQGYPLIIRPAYTLGGSGGGIANNETELRQIAAHGLAKSPVTEILVEASISGYKEIEFEVLRDADDQCLVVASMENFDPVGIHTGDSIVFSPVQTLSDHDYQSLRDAAFKIIRALKIQGGANVQLALDPHSQSYDIIEVNPRVSRSSALASKATGYPIAKLAAKLAVGCTLDQLLNLVTGQTKAAFEPALDYVVAKIPRWPFDKFTTADRQLGTQMKATGEVMAIGRNIETALMKAIRSLEIGALALDDVLFPHQTSNQLLAQLLPASDQRLFQLAELLRRGVDEKTLHDKTGIDSFFIEKIAHLVQLEQTLKSHPFDADLLKKAKETGFPDAAIARYWQSSAEKIRQFRTGLDLLPTYKMVNTAAGEFQAQTPYYYAVYEQENESAPLRNSVVVLGSGPIRIGQGVEFDYATVQAVQAIQAAGYKAIVINSNPETVSTDFSMSDKLYFEPVTLEDVLNVVDLEKPLGVIVQFGGQTAINLAAPLQNAGVKLLGSSLQTIQQAEDRKAFSKLVMDLKLAEPTGQTVYSAQRAQAVAEQIGYPVLLRPSYVLGGSAMIIAHDDQELADYLSTAVLSLQHPLLIDAYLVGREAEVDVLSDGETVVVPGIMEQVEGAGVHSGDSISLYPCQSFSPAVQAQMLQAAIKLVHGLGTVGLMNVQFVVKDEQVYIIEANPRASRTVPFISKATATPLADLATQVILGRKLKDLGFHTGLLPVGPLVYAKAPVFSFSKLPGVDALLGPEMKSTGEVMGVADTVNGALAKAFVAAGYPLLTHGSVLLVGQTLNQDFLSLVEDLTKLGLAVWADAKSCEFLQAHHLSVEHWDNTKNSLSACGIKLLLSSKSQSTAMKDLRRQAVEQAAIVMISFKTAQAYVSVLKAQQSQPNEMVVYEQAADRETVAHE